MSAADGPVYKTGFTVQVSRELLDDCAPTVNLHDEFVYLMTHTADEVQLRDLLRDGFAFRDVSQRTEDRNPAVLAESRDGWGNDDSDWWDAMAWREVFGARS